MATKRIVTLQAETEPLEIDLERLDQASLATLAQAHLGGKASASLLALINSRAEGNPFFAEQILRYAQEEGLLTEQNGQWVFAPGQEVPALPVDVNALLVARLDQLVQEVKETVQSAAILGREFETRVLARLLELQESHPGDLTGALGIAEHEAIWAALSDIRYIFRHALMWDAAYNMQLHARRQTLHAVVVEALESLYANDLSNHYGELAYHAERAHLDEKARAYLFKAADTAKNAYQNSQADDYYTRALRLTPPNDLAGQYDLLLARLEVYQTQGRLDECQRDLQRLDELARNLGDSEHILEILIRNTEIIYDKGEAAQSLASGLQALSLAESLQSSKQAIRIYIMLGNAAQRLGGYDQAQEFAQKGLTLARALGDRLMECRLLNTIGMFHAEQNNLRLATENFHQSLELSRQVSDLRLQARPLANLGMTAIRRGDFVQARLYSEQSLALARQIGARNGETVILGNLGFIASSLGNYAQASEYTEASLRIAREIGDKYNETIALINLSAQFGALGEHHKAIQSAGKGLQIAYQIGEQSAAAWAYTYLAHSLFAIEKHEEAEEAYQNALRIRRELNQLVLATEPLAGQARIATARGETQRARQVVDEILSILEQSGNLDGTDQPLRVYFTCYQVLKQANDARAHSMLENAYSLLQARSTQIADEVNRQRFLESEENRAIQTAWQQVNV